MVNTAEQHVFFLDDDPEVRNAVRRILRGIGIKVSCFGDPATCMAKLRSQKCNLLITDLRMPGTDGFEVLEEVKHLTPWVPVLVISGYGDIPAAVRAVKAGAVDFIEKPLDKAGFIRRIKLILGEIDSADVSLGKPLTQAEIGVLGLVIDGKSSKEIARMFHRSTRTIEGHRSHIMHKLNAGNLLDLLKRVAAMGLVDLGAKPELARMSEILRTGHGRSET
jgi:two-component system response regulator FixJ